METGFWQKLGQVFPVVPIPLLASLALTAALAGLDPVHEGFAIYASNLVFYADGSPNLWERIYAFWRLAAGIAALAVAGFILWSTSRIALIVAGIPKDNSVAAWVPRMIGAAPLFGAATGMIAVAFSTETGRDEQAVLFISAQFLSVLGYYIFTRFVNRTKVNKRRDEGLLTLLLLGVTYAAIGYAIHFCDFSEMRLRVLGVALWSALTCGAVSLALLGQSTKDLSDDWVGLLVSWLGGGAMLLGTAAAVGLIVFPQTTIWLVGLGLLQSVAPWVPIVAFVVTSATALSSSPQPRIDKGNVKDVSGQSHFAKWHLFAVFAIFALGLAMLIWKVDIASLVLGPLALVAMLMCLVTIFAGYAGIAARKWCAGFPLTGALLLVTFVLTSLGWNNKTWVRTVPSNVTEKRSVAEAFIEWDSGVSSDPVYIIAAQGGGLFAGYHVAYTLAALAEDYPQIAGQIFAISGVSGGSVGAGVFAAIQYQAEMADSEEIGSQRATVRNVLRRDFLSPLLGGLASYDLSLTLLQLPIPYGDRARALEASFEAAVERGIGSHGLALLRGSVFDAWEPGRSVPALFLNTTEVDTGARIVFGPVLSAQQRSNSTRNIRDITEGHVPPLSTAMGLSARFPLVTPPGRLRVSLGEATGAIRLADGGYFDNTGLETAADVIAAIRSTKTEREIRLIILRSSSEPFEPGTLPSAQHGNLAAPLTAFVEAWRSRAALTRDVAKGRTQGLSTVGPNASVFEFQLNDRDYDFTLSWTLSRRTFCQIELDVEQDLEKFVARFKPEMANKSMQRLRPVQIACGAGASHR